MQLKRNPNQPEHFLAVLGIAIIVCVISLGAPCNPGTPDDSNDASHSDAEHSDSEYTDGEHSDSEYNDGEHNDGEYTDGEHNDGEYNDGEHNDGEYNDGEYTDSEPDTYDAGPATYCTSTGSNFSDMGGQLFVHIKNQNDCPTNSTPDLEGYYSQLVFDYFPGTTPNFQGSPDGFVLNGCNFTYVGNSSSPVCPCLSPCGVMFMFFGGITGLPANCAIPGNINVQSTITTDNRNAVFSPGKSFNIIFNLNADPNAKPYGISNFTAYE